MGNQLKWPPHDIVSLKNQLELLAKSVESPVKTRGDDEQMWLTRFLVIRSCGYLEQAVIEVIRSYVREKSHGLVRSFAISHLEYIANPTSGNLCTLVGRLDAGLADDLREYLDQNDEYFHRQLSALVDKRHRIAHGLNEGVNRSHALGYYQVSVDLAEWFIARLDPRNGVKNRLRIGQT
jgi:hypothetical protein